MTTATRRAGGRGQRGHRRAGGPARPRWACRSRRDGRLLLVPLARRRHVRPDPRPRSPSSTCRCTGSTSAATGSPSCSPTDPEEAGPCLRRPTGVIHDIGYQRYTGPRLGRGYVVRSLYAHGLRTAFGLGRSAKAKIFPWFIIGVVSAGRGHRHRDQGADRRDRADVRRSSPTAMSWLIMLLRRGVAPELVSRDLRSGVLPLYFSRPLRRSDYALAKLAALVTAVFLLLGGPQLLMFLGSAFTADGRHVRGLGRVRRPAARPGVRGALRAGVRRASALLVASLTGRRAFAAGGDRGGVPDDHADRRRCSSVLPLADRQPARRPGQPGRAWCSGVGDLAVPTTSWSPATARRSAIGDFGPLYGLVVGAARRCVRRCSCWRGTGRWRT